MDIFSITNNNGEYFYEVADDGHLYKKVEEELRKQKNKNNKFYFLSVLISWIINFLLISFYKNHWVFVIVWAFVGIGTFFITDATIKLLRDKYDY